MPEPISGLSGLSPLRNPARLIEENAQATPEERSGNAVDPRHANWGEQAAPYPWQSSMAMGGSHGPYGPENQLLDDEYWWLSPAGDPADDVTEDRTPYHTHGGPKQKGILSGPVPNDGPEAVANQLRQSMANHAIDTNAGKRGFFPPQALGIQNDQWVDFWVMNPGDTRLGPLPPQQMSSHFMFGSRDRTQTFARQNEYSFDSAHMHRRYATGEIPGNNYWMRPGGRVLVKNMAGVARPPIGATSPFAGDDVFANYDPYGAVLMNTPTEYVPPPQPNLVPGQYNQAEAPVEFY